MKFSSKLALSLTTALYLCGSGLMAMDPDDKLECAAQLRHPEEFTGHQAVDMQVVKAERANANYKRFDDPAIRLIAKSFEDCLIYYSSVKPPFAIQLMTPHPSYSKLQPSMNPAQLREDFTGHQALDMQVVKAYRANYQRFDGKVQDAFYAFDNPAIRPIAKSFEDFLVYYSSVKSSPFAQQLIAELDFHKKFKGLSPLVLIGMHLRFAASISEITEDEKNLFDHVPHAELYFGTLEKEAWRHMLPSFVSTEKYNTKGFGLDDNYYASHLPRSAIELINDTMLRALPPQTAYPMINQDKLGVSFLVKSNLDDVYPIAIPVGKNKAHGTQLSPFGFAVHDALHEKFDQRQFKFIGHVIKRANKHVLEGKDLKDFVRVYPPVAIQKYQLVMSALQDLYTNMVTKLLPQRGIGQYRKAMAGFVWTLHERPHFPGKLYGMNDVDRVMETITANTSYNTVNAAKSRIDSWESSYDPLETSPIDGSSQLDDDAIVRWVLVNMTIGEAQSYKYAKGSFDEPIFENYISSKQVVRTDRFIDVIITQMNGEELKYSFPTLYHKWHNLDDTLGLLKYGGTVIEKPDLEAVSRGPFSSTLIELNANLDVWQTRLQEQASLLEKETRSHMSEPLAAVVRQTAEIVVTLKGQLETIERFIQRNRVDICKYTLNQAELAIAEHVDFFRQVAHYFNNPDPKGTGKSPAKRYFKKSFALEQSVKDL